MGTWRSQWHWSTCVLPVIYLHAYIRKYTLSYTHIKMPYHVISSHLMPYHAIPYHIAWLWVISESQHHAQDAKGHLCQDLYSPGPSAVYEPQIIIIIIIIIIRCIIIPHQKPNQITKLHIHNETRWRKVVRWQQQKHEQKPTFSSPRHSSLV